MTTPITTPNASLQHAPVCPPDCPECAMSAPPPCPPDCAECAELDAREVASIEDEHRAQLARHDEHCIAEAVTDAFATGHDDEESAWFVAAQLLDDGHSPCRCAASDSCERQSSNAS
jgi:hypothetical protein